MRPTILFTVLLVILATKKCDSAIYEIDTLFNYQRYLTAEYYEILKYYETEESMFGSFKLAESPVRGIFSWEFPSTHNWRLYILASSAMGYRPSFDSLELLIKHKATQEIWIYGTNRTDVTLPQTGRTLLNWQSSLYRLVSQGSVGSNPMIHLNLSPPEYIIIDKIIVAINETVPISMY